MGRSFWGRVTAGAACALALGCVDLTAPYEVVPDAAAMPKGGQPAAGRGGAAGLAAAGAGGARPGGGAAGTTATSLCLVEDPQGKLWDFESGTDLYPNGARGMTFELVVPSAGAQSTTPSSGSDVLCGEGALRWMAIGTTAEAGVRGLFAPRNDNQYVDEDATAYRGIRFLYRSNGTPLVFRLQTALGRYEFAVDGAIDWRNELVTFQSMAPDRSGTPSNPPATLDRAKLHAVEWLLPAGTRRLDLDQIGYFK
jgi:hypothetical protein